MTNTYLPFQLQAKKFLLEEGDLTGKVWDDEALAQWELAENAGKDWPGRQVKSDLGRQ